MMSGQPERGPERPSGSDVQESPLVRPPLTDADWDGKIKRAREAWEAAKRLRKDMPAGLMTQYVP
jgi:hypothetical protein